MLAFCAHKPGTTDLSNPPPRLARTAFLGFGRRPGPSTLLTYPHLPPYPLNLLTLGGLNLACGRGAGLPRTLLKPSKNLLNPFENLLKPLQTRSEPPKTFQNLFKTTKTLGKRPRGPSRSSPGRLPDLQKSIFSVRRPLKFNIFSLRTLKINIFFFRRSKIEYFLSPDH